MLTSSARGTIGIDPGIRGALAYIGEDGSVRIWDTPSIMIGKRRRYEIPKMLQTLIECKTACPRVQAFIEQVHSMPKQGVASSFTLGFGLGLWVGLLSALMIPYTVVEPVRWKRDMLAGMPHDKQAARLRAMQLYPALASQLSKTSDHNRADALLIASYGMTHASS